MTPAGHLSVSYLAAFPLNREWMIPVIVGGLLPDIDFLLLPFPWFNAYHRVLSHNLLFIVLAAAAGAVAVGKDRRLATAAGMCAGGLLHLLTDACLDGNPTNGVGVMILWPFDDRFFSPVNFLDPDHAAPGWSAPLDQMRRAFGALKWEVGFYLLAGVAVLSRRRARMPKPPDGSGRPAGG